MNTMERVAGEDYLIDFDDLDFGDPIGKGNFGKVYKGDYFGTPVRKLIICVPCFSP